MLRNQIKYCFPFVLCAVVLLLCGPASLPAAVRKAEGDSVFYRMYLSSKEKGDMEEAMENAAIFLESMDTSFVSQSASALAIELSEYLEDNFKFSKALQWRLLARKSQDISELQVRAENEYRLARLYYRTGQYDKAFEYGTAAQEMFSEIGDRPSALRCINLLGAVYYVCKDFDNSNLYFRRPDLFDGLLALSGIYSSRYGFGDYMDELVYENSPLDFLPNMPMDHPYLDMYRAHKAIICCGQGAWEQPDTTYRLKEILEAKGIPAWVDIWGYDVNHDWDWWYKQVAYFVPHLLHDAP